MSMTLSGSGTITGLVAGGLPDGVITGADIADDAVTLDKFAQRMVLYTKPSTSGTSVEFTPADNTGIPVWAKRVTFLFSGISTTATTNYLVQLGSTTFATSGYISISIVSTSTNAVDSFATAGGFGIFSAGDAASPVRGSMTLNLIGANTWISTLGGNRIGWSYSGGGDVTLSGVLDRIRIVPVTASTFDAGQVAILIEG